MHKRRSNRNARAIDGWMYSPAIWRLQRSVMDRRTEGPTVTGERGNAGCQGDGEYGGRWKRVGAIQLSTSTPPRGAQYGDIGAQTRWRPTGEERRPADGCRLSKPNRRRAVASGTAAGRRPAMNIYASGARSIAAGWPRPRGAAVVIDACNCAKSRSVRPKALAS